MFNLLKSVMSDKSDDDVPRYCTAVIVAAGSGKRMKSEENKQFMKLLGRPLISYTLESFEECDAVDEIVIVAREEDIVDMKDVVEAFHIEKANKIIVGGAQRHDSVYNGLLEAAHNTSVVVIHDGARPFVLPVEIKETIRECEKTGAAALAVPLKDTIKKADKNGFVEQTLDRETIWAVQTPQTFSYDVIKAAYEMALQDKDFGTDDCYVVEKMGRQVKLIEGSYENIKVTTPDDIILAESILESRGDEW